MRAADDDDHFALAREFLGGTLALLGGLADGVHEANFRLWKARTDEGNELTNAGDGLRGLRGDAEARALAQRSHVRLGEHDVALGEVFGEAANFHVVAHADDDGVPAVAREHLHGAVRDVDEGTCGLQHMQAALAGAALRGFGRAVGRDHHGVGLRRGRLAGKPDAPRAEVGEDGFVVDQLAEDG